jgi:hypothetical protein
VCDAVAGGFEVDERGCPDPIAMGGVVLPFINLTYWLWALRRVGR